MTIFADIDGSFGSLMDTLQNRFSPLYSVAVSTQWLAALGHASAIARETTAWNALPPENPSYTDIVAALDAAARGLASSANANDADILTALSSVEAALAKLDVVLG